MRSRRTRLALVAVLALAFSVTAGMLSISAQAKKGGGGKTASASLSSLAIPDKAAGAGTKNGVATGKLHIGKKFKKSLVDRVELTYTISSSAAAGPNQIIGNLIAPNGRTVALTLPNVQATQTVLGSLTETPNTSEIGCIGPAVCANANANVFAPYTGAKIANVGFTAFYGVKVAGDWTLQLQDNTNGIASTATGIELKIKPAKNPEETS